MRKGPLRESPPELRRWVRVEIYHRFGYFPTDGATLTTEQTVAMCDELIHAHRHLPPATLLR